MATITRTVMNSIEHTTYVSVESKFVVPECITRFSPGTRVEVRPIRGGKFGVQPIDGDSLRIFGEEIWHLA